MPFVFFRFAAGLMKQAALLWAVLLFSGCASLSETPLGAPPRESLDSFALDGRFSLYQTDKSYSGRLSWKQRGGDGEILLSSPFGQGIAEIVSDARGARMTTADGKTYAAPDAETLTREVLGYALPLAQLADWVRARPGAGEVRRDDFGRPLNLRLGAWIIDYEYADRDPQSPPRRIDARRANDFELRLFVDAWQSLPAEEKSP